MKLTDYLTIERRLTGVDLETTGKNPVDARIVEISLEVFDPDGSVKTWTQRMNPGVPIPKEATEKHGITDEMVKGLRGFNDYAPHIVKAFVDCDLAGYNVKYDRQVLAAEFKRSGIDWDGEDCCVVDGFRLWQHVNPRKLDDADREWLTDEDRAELGEGQSHSADFDILRSTRIVGRMLERFPAVPRTPKELHELLNPGAYDADGKLVRREDGQLVITFGQHKDKPLSLVPRDYLQWIVNKGDFGRKVKGACRTELERRKR